MLRLLFWAAVLALGWLVLRGQVSLPGIPSEEVVYATPPAAVGCGPAGCVVVYALEVTNPGRSTQESVRIRVRASTLDAPLVPPTVRRSSGAAAVKSAVDRTAAATYDLGPLAPDERASLVFVLRAPSRDAALGWDRILLGVDPSLGAGRPGDPAALTVGRMLHAAGRALQRAIAALAGSS